MKQPTITDLLKLAVASGTLLNSIELRLQELNLRLGRLEARLDAKLQAIPPSSPPIVHH